MFREGNFLPNNGINVEITEGVSIRVLTTVGMIDHKTFLWNDDIYDFWDTFKIKGEEYNIHIDFDEEWSVAIYESEEVTGENGETWFQVDMSRGFGIHQSTDPECFRVIPAENVEGFDTETSKGVVAIERAVTSIEECEDMDNLYEAVIDQIKEDLATNDITAIEELLSFVPKANLIGYLREE